MFSFTSFLEPYLIYVQLFSQCVIFVSCWQSLYSVSSFFQNLFAFSSFPSLKKQVPLGIFYFIRSYKIFKYLKHPKHITTGFCWEFQKKKSINLKNRSINSCRVGLMLYFASRNMTQKRLSLFFKIYWFSFSPFQIYLHNLLLNRSYSADKVNIFDNLTKF